MKERIKVVEIIADSDLGGGPSHVFGLLKSLDQQRFEPFLICPEGQLSNKVSQIKGVTIFHVPFKSKYDLISYFELKNYLTKIKSSRDPFGPMVVHSHGTRAGLFASIVASKFAFKIYTEHRWDSDYHLKNPISDFWQKRMLRRVLRRMDRVIAVSSSVRDFLVKNNFVAKDQVQIIPNGIDLVASTEYRVPSTRVVNRAPVIGTIGNLNTQKGQIYLIEAMEEILKKFPLATLEIIGEGELKKSLKFKVESLKLERHVSFLGRQSSVDKFLKKWDVFALPSVAETFGIVVLEAMNAGTPVVATRVGGVPDIIQNKKNGLLVPSRDSKALADSIIELLDHPALAAKLKRGGIERVKDFDWQKVIKKIEKVYAEPFELEK